MKTILLILAAMTILSTQSFADTVDKWSGTGTAYSPDGQELSSYKVTVINTENENHVTQSVATITLADGTQKVVTQKITSNGNKWSVESNLGKGGGLCYGKDLCENYISDDNGLAYATTIVVDGATGRRQLTTELQNGKPVKILRDNLIHLQ